MTYQYKLDPMRNIVAFFLQLLLLATMGPVAGFSATNTIDGSGTSQKDRQVFQLLQNISQSVPKQFPSPVVRDPNGAIVSLGVPSQYVDDTNLELIGSLSAVPEISIYLDSDRKRVAPILTEMGISSLARIANLRSLKLVCLNRLDKGVLRGVSKITQLRHLTIYNIPFSSDEFQWLGDMTNLTDLEVDTCKSFGNKEASYLKNLTNLHTLQLIRTSVSQDLSNALSSIQSLTNIVITNSIVNSKTEGNQH